MAVGRQADMSGGGLGFNPNRPSTSPQQPPPLFAAVTHSPIGLGLPLAGARWAPLEAA